MLSFKVSENVVRVLPVLLRYVNGSVIDFIFNEKGGLLNCSIRVFLAIF